MTAEAKTRPLYVIVREIRYDWTNPYYGAEPYMFAMASMNDIDTPYGLDSGASIVRYFLANARTWRGETARRVKAELRAMIEGRY